MNEFNEARTSYLILLLMTHSRNITQRIAKYLGQPYIKENLYKVRGRKGQYFRNIKIILKVIL